MNTFKADTTENYKQLGYAIALQAIKDYFDTVSDASKAKIIKDLRSPYMQSINDCLSVIAAEKLETNPEEVRKNMEETRQAELRHSNVQTPQKPTAHYQQIS